MGSHHNAEEFKEKERFLTLGLADVDICQRRREAHQIAVRPSERESKRREVRPDLYASGVSKGTSSPPRRVSASNDCSSHPIFEYGMVSSCSRFSVGTKSVMTSN